MIINELMIIKNSEGRYELSNGGYLSSPSRMLKPLTFEKYENIPKWQLEKAAEFGTQIHEAIEIYHKLYNDEEEARKVLYSGKHHQVFDQYLNWIKDNNVEVLAVEQLVYNSIQRYYGIIDIIALINGEMHIIDLKIRSKLISDDNWLCEKLQVAFYTSAYFEMLMMRDIEPFNKEYPIKKSILIINKNTKTKRLFKTFELTEQEENIANSLIRLNIAKIEWKEAQDGKKSNESN